VDIQAYPFLV